MKESDMETGCEKVSNDDLLLIAYGEREDAEILEHVKTCPQCRAYIEGVKELHLLAGQAGMYYPDGGLALSLQVEARRTMEKGKTSRLESFGERLRDFFGESPVLRLSPAAAAIVVIFFIGLYTASYKGESRRGLAASAVPTYLDAGLVSKTLADVERAVNEEYGRGETEEVYVEEEFSLDSGIDEIELAMIDLEYDMGLAEDDADLDDMSLDWYLE